MRFEARDGHLHAHVQWNAHGQEELFVYDHQGHLLDVLRRVEEPAPAAGGPTASPNGHCLPANTGDAT